MSPPGRLRRKRAEPTRVAALCATAVRTLPIDGAAIILASTAGHRVLLGSSDQRSKLLEDLLTTCHEGPAIDAVTEARPVLAGDLTDTATHARWPMFTAEALRLGASAVFALPLQIGAINLGAFVSYRQWAGPLDPGEFSRLLRISDAAAYAVLDLTVPSAHAPAPGAVRTDLSVVEDSVAGFVSAEIHQASGMVMVQLGIPVQGALARLRAYAFAQERPLIDVAREVIARTLQFER